MSKALSRWRCSYSTTCGTSFTLQHFLQALYNRRIRCCGGTSGIRQTVCNLSAGKNAARRHVLVPRGHQRAANSARPYVSQYQTDTTRVLRQEAIMQQHELLELVLDALAELATLHSAAAAAAERAWLLLDKQARADLRITPSGDQSTDCLPCDHLEVNPVTFTVEWHGRCCSLGPTILFKLIDRLAHRPGRYFTYDILMQDVWGRRCSHATIRSAVKRLRQLLCSVGMPHVAAAIRGRRECYGIFLDDNYA